MGFPDFTFRSELEGQTDVAELGHVVRKELELFRGNLIGLLRSAGLQDDGTFTTINAQTLNTTNVNVTNVGAASLVLRATRTLNNTQFKTLASTPFELFSPTALGIAPGIGYVLNPIRADWNLNSKFGAYGNVSSGANLQITYGASTTPFGPSTAMSGLCDLRVGLQAVSEGFFNAHGYAPSGLQQDVSLYENLSFFVYLHNGLGDLTGGGSGNSLTVNVYYVVSPVSSTTASNTIVYTTSVRKVEPPAANGVSLTPDGTAFTFSAWTEIDSATSADWALAAIAFNPAVSAAIDLEFEVGVGAAGSEVAVASIAGFLSTEATCANHRLAWTIPIGGRIGSGDRVSVRLRKSGTDTTAWTIALEYFEEPMAGNAVVSPVVGSLICDNATLPAVTPSSTDAAYSNWVVQAQSSPLTTDIVMGAALVGSPGAAEPYEISYGHGPTGQEITAYRQRGYSKNISALGSGGLYYTPCYPALPIIRTGQGYTIRMRKNGTSTASWFLQLATYAGAAFPLLTTEQENQWYPDAPDTLVSLTYSGTPWTNSAYVVMFTTTVETAILAVLLNIDTNVKDIEVDIATGSPGNEVVKTTVRQNFQSLFSGDIQAIPMVLARNIDAGEIISCRVRMSAGGGVAVGLGYMESPDFFQRVDTVAVCYPAAANAVSVAGNTTAWNSSVYGELVSATASAVYLTHVNYLTTLTGIEVEFDLATGGASSETVIGTFRTFIGNTSGGGNGQIPIIPPIRVATGTRVAVRFRKTGTSSTGFTFSAGATPV